MPGRSVVMALGFVAKRIAAGVSVLNPLNCVSSPRYTQYDQLADYSDSDKDEE